MTKQEICANCGQRKEQHNMIIGYCKNGIMKECEKFKPKEKKETNVQRFGDIMLISPKPQNHSPQTKSSDEVVKEIQTDRKRRVGSNNLNIPVLSRNKTEDKEPDTPVDLKSPGKVSGSDSHGSDDVHCEMRDWKEGEFEEWKKKKFGSEDELDEKIDYIKKMDSILGESSDDESLSSKLKTLYKLYLKLDDCSREMQKIEQNITKEVEKQLGEDKVDILFSDEDYQDGLHAYASNGEFNMDYEEFVEIIKKTLKKSLGRI